jgi:hypothetical protein
VHGWCNEMLLPPRVFGGDHGNRGDTAHHPDSDLINRSVSQRTMADVARPPRVVSSAR